MSRPMNHARLAALASVLLLPSAVVAQEPTKAPPPMAVKPASIPPFQEATLRNGLRILLVESHRQPVVSLALMLPAGNAYDPSGKEGEASMVADVLTKGAGKRTAEQVAEAIESVGGSIGASAGPDFMYVRTSVLRDDAPLAFELLGDAIRQPTFATKEVELSRTQTLSGLQLEQSNPAALASRYFAANLYGQHPYAKRPTPASVRSLTLDDLRAFQHDRLVPKGALLVVAGALPMSRTRELAERAFGAWSGAPAPTPARAKPPTRDKTEILLVHRPASVQSNIVVGNLTFGPTDPAFYALNVANKVLGGGTDARLFTILREKKSWTYGSFSSITRARDIGNITATAEVRNVVTDSALAELLNIERSLGSSRLESSELDAAKNSLVGSLPLQIETAQGLSEQVGRFAMLGLPKDYIRTLRPRLAAVTASEVEHASRAYIRPDKALIVVVGDGTQVYDKLAKIAPVRIVSAQGDPMTPGDLVATAPSKLPVDVTKLVTRADSFAVFVQGNAMGGQKTTLEKTPDGYVYRSAMAIGPIMSQSMATTFTSDLKPVSVKGGGKVQGMDLSVDLAYANGRVKGSTTLPTAAGMKTTAIDTTVGPTALDGNMIGALVPALPWSPTAKFSVNAFEASSGALRPVTLAVTGTESVTVPAGTFQAYRVEITGQSQPISIFVTTAAPYRIVKLAPTGSPIEFQLVK